MYRGMTSSDRRLLRHLALAVVLKLLVLTLLWLGFIRDARVSVDSPAAAAHLAADTTPERKTP